MTTPQRLKRLLANRRVRLTLWALVLADAITALVFDAASINHSTLISQTVDSVVFSITLGIATTILIGLFFWVAVTWHPTPEPTTGARTADRSEVALLAATLARIAQDEDARESETPWCDRVAERLANEGWSRTRGTRP